MEPLYALVQSESNKGGCNKFAHETMASFPHFTGNSSHDGQGCTQVQLRASGGDGLFYCFAAQ